MINASPHDRLEHGQIHQLAHVMHEMLLALIALMDRVLRELPAVKETFYMMEILDCKFVLMDIMPSLILKLAKFVMSIVLHDMDQISINEILELPGNTFCKE